MNAENTLRHTIQAARSAARQALPARFRADPERFAANEEPRLEELLSDPITVCLMTSDGLGRDQVTSVLDTVRDRLGPR